jgi:hypothetical protein
MTSMERWKERVFFFFFEVDGRDGDGGAPVVSARVLFRFSFSLPSRLTWGGAVDSVTDAAAAADGRRVEMRRARGAVRVLRREQACKRER